jgi:uncharacterized protein (DUF488 family)
VSVVVHSVGHSNHTSGELLALLEEHGVDVLVDVRRYPGSRRHPHFRREALAESLSRAGIEYRHEPELGGHRVPDPASHNVGLHDEALRGYADWMYHHSFRDAVERVAELARTHRPCLMCAEADPARCHRSLLSDALSSLGVEVVHVLGPGSARPHRLHPAAVVQGPCAVRYPPQAGDQLELF